MREFIDTSEVRAESELSAGRDTMASDLQTFADMAGALLRNAASQPPASDSSTSAAVLDERSVATGPTPVHSQDAQQSVASDTMGTYTEDAAVPDLQSDAPGSTAGASLAGAEETKEDVMNGASLRQKRLNIRIGRDRAHCPKVVCYSWHLIPQTRKPLPNATVDLARLHLAPKLRAGVNNGDIDLLVEADEQHRTIHGRETVIFVARNLAGVTPHNRSL